MYSAYSRELIIFKTNFKFFERIYICIKYALNKCAHSEIGN